MSNMKNVYTKKISYENFLGEPREMTLHFHLTPREFSDWMLNNMNEAIALQVAFEKMAGLGEKDAVSPENMTVIHGLVKLLAEMSYGVPSEDGEYFDKTEAKKFTSSAAYDEFRLWLFMNPSEVEKFVNTVLNPEVIDEFVKKTAKQTGVSEEKLQELSSKKLSDLSPEELMALYKQKTTVEMAKEQGPNL